jgi:hypothetical protein
MILRAGSNYWWWSTLVAMGYYGDQPWSPGPYRQMWPFLAVRKTLIYHEDTL